MLFDRNIEPCCMYCRYAAALGYNEVACVRRGIMDVAGSCGSFRYEPTKRVPVPAPSVDATGLTEEDFAI